MINTKDLDTLRAAATIVDELCEDDMVTARMNARPNVTWDELMRLITALEKVERVKNDAQTMEMIVESRAWEAIVAYRECWSDDKGWHLCY